jgi:ribosomal protein L1
MKIIFSSAKNNKKKIGINVRVGDSSFENNHQKENLDLGLQLLKKHKQFFDCAKDRIGKFNTKSNKKPKNFMVRYV